MQRTFRDKLWPRWQRYTYFQGPQYILPDDLPRRLAEHEQAIEFCVNELIAGGWPESIDHTDLHHRNAMVQPDGQIRIYDWDEAIIGCPFFSLDKLLDTIGESVGLAYRGPFATLPRPDVLARTAAVRAAYVEALPWDTRSSRERALAVALCLAPFRTLAAYLGVDAPDLGDGSTVDTVPLDGLVAARLARAFDRWDMLDH